MNATLDVSPDGTRGYGANVARWLMIALIVVVTFSTALTNLIELFVYLWVLFNKESRDLVIDVFAEPLVKFASLLLIVPLLALLWSEADWSTGFGAAISWRKVLLLPIAAALFRDVVWKNRLIAALLSTLVIYLFYSYAVYFMDVGTFGHHIQAKSVLRNHATQGILFAVAVVFLSLFVIKNHLTGNNSWIRIAMAMLALAFLANLAFVTTGRSGYLAVLVMSAWVAWSAVNKRFRVVAVIIISISVLGGLWLSPVANKRIQAGISEFQNIEKYDTETSLGIRKVFWINTIELIKQKPLLGVGTGGFENAYMQLLEKQGPEIKDWMKIPSGDPHNQYLEVWAEQGLLGLLVLLLFIYTALRTPTTSIYTVLGVGVVLSWCATSFFSGHFATFTEGRVLYVLCGVLLFSSTVAKTR